MVKEMVFHLSVTMSTLSKLLVIHIIGGEKQVQESEQITCALQCKGQNQ